MPRGARERQHERRLLTVGERRFRRRDDVEGEGQQAVARKDRRRLVEGDVHRRLSAAHVVVVHGREVVMDERIAVDAFERGACSERRFRIAAEEGRAFGDEKRPQPLAAVEHAMAHGSEQVCRAGDFARAHGRAEQCLEQRFDRDRVGLEARRKG